jgi:hypothetical protein
MMSTIKSILIVSIFALQGCAGNKSLVPVKVNHKCVTTVEGFYHSKIFYPNTVPALLLKDVPLPKILHGQILGLEHAGIRFDPVREGLLYDPPAVLYKYDEIVCAVNDSRQVVYGVLPDKYSDVWSLEVFLVSTDQPDAEPLKMALEANQKFSYCLDPGNYVVTKIEFKSRRNWIDKSVSIPKLGFTAVKGHANYIGDLYLDYASPGSPNVHVIPFEIKYRPKAHAAAGQFGLAGAAPANAPVENAAGIHTLRIEPYGHFSAGTRLPLNVSPLLIAED